MSALSGEVGDMPVCGMKRSPEAAWERAMKIQEVMLRAIAKRITWWQAAEIIGISCRQMRRWQRRYEEHGYEGLRDRRRVRVSEKRVPLAQVEEVLRLYQDQYFDFNVRHFHEQLMAEHGIKLSYTWVKLALQGAGLVKSYSAAKAEVLPGVEHCQNKGQNNRAEKLFTELFPGRSIVPKTLAFAKDDTHAEDIVHIVREVFGKGNEFCKKITYRTTGEKTEDLISAFRNSCGPRIVVSVDMISTGTDIRPLECLIFMRDVKSRVYFEQMKGRGTRTIDDTEFICDVQSLASYFPRRTLLIRHPSAPRLKVT